MSERVPDCQKETWRGLRWSAWISLEGDNEVYKQLANTGGLYRIRAVGHDSLIYIGQTGRNLRERLRALRKGVVADEMPFNDPHTAAPNLWVWQREGRLQYECSVATVELDTPNRQALEDMLLWAHRIETGKSTLCNYGRFHPHWMKSLDRRKGIRGYRLEWPGNPSGGYCTQPLQLHGRELDDDWMGLVWSSNVPLTKANLKIVPCIAGVYRIFAQDKRELLYIGESKDIRQRLTTHVKSVWPTSVLAFSWSTMDGMDSSHHRHEIEVDLIGAFYSVHKRPPACQC
ncbi:MAG: GIY-YIG nuclease family protein [Shewanella sp.]|nr:GIY-YIG nuclease family protein [Shewanella sp.]